MAYYVGVDAGASNLRLRVEDEAGQLVGESWGRPASLTLGADRAAANIRDALVNALLGADVSIDQCIVGCGIAGARQTGLKQRVCQLLGDAGAISIVSDTYIALLGAHGGRPGAMVVVGTGSAGVSLDHDGRIRQVGGWGPLGGDDGSGCWVGREAVRACLRRKDDHLACDEADTKFFMEILETLGGQHNAILDWLRLATPTILGSLAPMVFDHAVAGSRAALQIVDRATLEMERLIRLASLDGELPTALTGGLSRVLADRLAPEPASWIVEPQADPVAGALRVARGKARAEIYSEII
ncbi:MAG: hypothetical protein KDH19_03135 [Geminicoccaceae bacterium]|nr:hypothetical protein [Geminicoccaceae bacterium]